MGTSVVTVNDLVVHFPVAQKLTDNSLRRKKQFVKAVDGVSFHVELGQTTALVGESGCGKTTIGRALVALEKPTSGSIEYRFDGSVTQLTSSSVDKSIRRRVQYIFQDPYSSLNPRMTIRTILQRPIERFALHTENREERINALISMVGLSKEQLDRYPHEFSGGQKQRISIARALAADPAFIIADEPTAALDVSIQAQVLNLLMTLREELDLTMLFISHDLGVVRQIADRVIVMYLGSIVETGATEDIFTNPLHPYTKSLLSAMPLGPVEEKKDRIRLSGVIPSPIDPPAGCRLHPRCPFAMPICAQRAPQERILPGDRQVYCHLLSDENK